MCTCEDPCMGRRSTPSVGRLTVLHEVVVTMHVYNFQYEFVNGNGNRTRSNIAIYIPVWHGRRRREWLSLYYGRVSSGRVW